MLYFATHLNADSDKIVEDAMKTPDLAKFVSAWGVQAILVTLRRIRPHQGIGAVWARIIVGTDKVFSGKA